MPYTITVYELPNLAPSQTAKARWSDSLKAESNRIILQLAKAFGYTGTDVNEALNYLRNMPAGKFQDVLAKPASEGWKEFFGATEDTASPVNMSALKMHVKIARAYAKYGNKVADAFDPQNGYFYGRVDAGADYWASNTAYTYRFVGDPPETPLGPAPFVAILVTGGRVPERLKAPEFEVNGDVFNAFKPTTARFARPAIIATIVGYGVLARYAKDAGLGDLANAILGQMKTVLDDISAMKADNVQSITWTVDFYNHSSLGEVVRIQVSVQEQTTTGGTA